MMKSFLFAVGYLLCLSEVNVEATPSIWIEPEDKREILEPGSVNGVDVFLQCIVNDLNAAYKVLWKKNGIVISDDLTMRQNLDYLFDTPRYSITQNTVGKQYALQISQITETTYQKDNGQYQCIVFNVNNNQIVTQSRIATVVIFDTVACLVNDTFNSNSQIVSAGSTTKVTCRTYPLSNPQVSVRLFKQGNDQSSLLSFQQSEQFLNAYYGWTSSKGENGITMTCVSNHSTFPSTKTCTVGPFTVQYKPDVTITPTSHTITSTLDSQVFTCNADATPSVQVDEYVWKYDGASIQPSHQFLYVSDHRNLLIRNMSPADNGMYMLICEVTNVIGTGSHSVLVTIDIHELKLPTTAVTMATIPLDLDSSRITQQEIIDGDNDIIIAGGVGFIIGIVLMLTVAVPLLIVVGNSSRRKLKTRIAVVQRSLKNELHSTKFDNNGRATDAVVHLELTQRTEQITAEDTGVSIDQVPIAIESRTEGEETGISYANASVTIHEDQHEQHYQSLRGQSDNVYCSFMK